MKPGGSKPGTSSSMAGRKTRSPTRKESGRGFSQWMSRACDGGVDALRHWPPPRAARRLSVEQLTQLPGLQRGLKACGFRGQL
jgi:hypothetical protein